LPSAPRLLNGAAVVAALLLVGLTLWRYGLGARGWSWSVAQVFLVFIAWFDFRTRRIPNAAVLPAAVLLVGARAVVASGGLEEVLIAGLVAFLVFFVLALAFGGGIGMGDVKLAGLLGLMLGRAALDALLIGCAAGGLVAVGLLVTKRASRKSTYAYGPYLALGGMLAILLEVPPRLV
jgi:leader peptidase (prepilin peptidase) / N-methyltransferase